MHQAKHLPILSGYHLISGTVFQRHFDAAIIGSLAGSSIFSRVSAYNFRISASRASRLVKHLGTASTNASTGASQTFDPSTSSTPLRLFALESDSSFTARIPTSFQNSSRYSFLLSPPASNFHCLSCHLDSSSLSLTSSLSGIPYPVMLFTKTCHTAQCPKYSSAMSFKLSRSLLFSGSVHSH